ncbi:MAG: amidase [Acidimicrobiales bacterium]
MITRKEIMTSPYHFRTIAELSILIREQRISPVELVTECLERVERLNPTRNAFITVVADQALAEAYEADIEITSGQWRGPMHGIPIAFKDMYDTAGIKTTAAFEHFRNRVPKKDASAVEKIKEAGAIIVGKTNMHTLAMGTTSQVSFYGPVRNPWNAEYIPGGSSGGSATAVATGMCFATVDTDAIGSCRLPASCCGVVGYKCSSGLIDNTGILEGEPADETIVKLATAAVTTRDVADTALVADALAGSSLAEAIRNDGAKPRIGIVTNFEATDGIQRGFTEAVAVFRTLGFRMDEATAPFDDNPCMQSIDKGRKTANEVVFKDVDVLILPTTASEVLTAKEVGEDSQALSAHNTFFANYYALPAVSVPCGVDHKGLPMGLQIVGRQGDDASVLQVANAYQRATKWHNTHPDTVRLI